MFIFFLNFDYILVGDGKERILNLKTQINQNSRKTTDFLKVILGLAKKIYS